LHLFCTTGAPSPAHRPPAPRAQPQITYHPPPTPRHGGIGAFLHEKALPRYLRRGMPKHPWACLFVSRMHQMGLPGAAWVPGTASNPRTHACCYWQSAHTRLLLFIRQPWLWLGTSSRPATSTSPCTQPSRGLPRPMLHPWGRGGEATGRPAAPARTNFEPTVTSARP
jgi:hypothetical protein